MIKYLIKRIVKNLTTTQQRVAIKKFKRHILSSVKKEEKVSLGQMRILLTEELGLKKGDYIMVSSSFGNLNADFSPFQLIELLIDIIGEDGIIAMPYYPPLNSTEWARGNNVFDMRSTRSGMGVLTNVFSKMPHVMMSCHPTKAICVWGRSNLVEAIIKEHEKSTTPFYWDSPYGRLLKMGSKSLCLGLKNIPMFHSIEDVASKNYLSLYEKQKYSLALIDKNGQQKSIDTYIHDVNIIDKCMEPGDYVAWLKLSSYKKIYCGYKYCVLVDNTEILNATQKEFQNNNTRLSLGNG